MKTFFRIITFIAFTCRLSLSVNAQEIKLTGIESDFSLSKEPAVSEKIFLHTDKDFYLAGEILWFKIYYIDANQHKPYDLSKLAYVEILDKSHKAVLQGKIALSDGTGKGSFFLPGSLNSGVYRIRAYTHWMKNFDADFFYEKGITIVNSIKSPDADLNSARLFNIRFFPEGGNLVQGLESKMAFRVSDHSGKGLPFKGFVVNQQNDTLAAFQPLKYGIGNFLFTPIAGDQYNAIIHVDDTVIVQQLPAVQEKGFVMSLTKEGDNQLRVSVKANMPFLNKLYLIVHTRQEIKASAERMLTDGTAEFLLDKSKLGEGVSRFTIFNQSKQPVCERLYFKRPASTLLIESNSSKHQFETRAKVELEVISKDETSTPIAANVSVSVYKDESDNATQSENISSYFWMRSDLKGNIESPGYYFSEAGTQVEEAVDNLMLTHGWRRFQMHNDAQRSKLPAGILPEWRGHMIYGKVTNTKTGLPGAGILTYLSVPGKRVQLYTSQSDQEGRIKFYTKDFYGSNEILLQTDNSFGAEYRIEITNPFSEKVSSFRLPAFELPSLKEGHLTDQAVSMQVQNVYAGDKLKRFFSADLDSVAFYGPPDNLYMLDDYVRFSTMEEVLREYVVEVLVRRQKENFRLLISGGLENKVYMDNPLTLFNGVPVFETDKIMQYDPLKVQKIDVIKRRYFYGPSMFNGIVNFTTYQPDPAMISGLNAVVFDYEGLQFTREFYSPVYETPEQLASRLPDFRNVLFWSADIKTDTQGKAKIEFYTSDQKGRYTVVLQGMNAEGRFGQQILYFDVK